MTKERTAADVCAYWRAVLARHTPESGFTSFVAMDEDVKLAIDALDARSSAMEGSEVGNREVAIELLGQITAAAAAGDALMLGPQSVKNLRGVLEDLLRSAGEPAAATSDEETCPKCGELNVSPYLCKVHGDTRTLNRQTARIEK